ncbi:hypothetical protein [Clostridium sp. BJN0001]|uniref:hypothetical protein n=1 Tax=Clostridium sp. BJN0001 TaxID=2930219 RepID=UPI001FD51427|nr:hypothetical protein [Clostridium sp. BJN0001]
MKKKFTILLLGPAGAGKSTFISALSEINIFEFVAAKSLGGANTTKLLTSYEFSNNIKK